MYHMASTKHAVLIIKTELFSNPGSVTGQNDACQVGLEALTGCVRGYGAHRHGTVVPTYPSIGCVESVPLCLSPFD